MALSTKLKVALPLGTAITATAVTAYLIISTNNDLEKNKLVDEALENLELTTKPFEEEIIKAQEESDKQEDDPEEKDSGKDKDQEAKEDKGLEEKKKSEAEPKDLKEALLNAEKEIKALANAGGGADKLEIKIPEEAKIGQEIQKTPIEHKPSSEEGQPQSIQEDEKSAKESEKDNLEEEVSSPKEKAPEASEDNPEPSTENPESEDHLAGAEEQELEATQDSQQESASRDKQSLDESSDIDGAPEEPDSGVAETSENQDGGPEMEQHEGQESELNSRSKDQNDGIDDEDGGTQMTEEEIKELVALQGKMAEFSDRLSNLLQLRRFK